MKTLSYVGCSEEEIVKGGQYLFGELWDGDGDGNELLDSGSVSTDGENIIDFKIIKRDENILESLVEVTDIF